MYNFLAFSFACSDCMGVVARGREFRPLRLVQKLRLIDPPDDGPKPLTVVLRVV